LVLQDLHHRRSFLKMLSGRDMPSLRFVTGGPADFRSWQNAARNLEVFGSKRFVKLIQDRLKQRSRIAYATLSR